MAMGHAVTAENGKRRERFILAASCAALLVALVAGVIMLRRARRIWNEEDAMREKVAVLARRDELRSAIAEITSGRRLATLSPDFDVVADLRSALQTAARAFQEEPLEGTENPGAFASIALELTSTDDGVTAWTSGPLQNTDRTWCLAAIAAGGRGQGSQRAIETARIIGVSWSAFVVDGEPHIGAIAWLTPRSR